MDPHFFNRQTVAPIGLGGVSFTRLVATIGFVALSTIVVSFEDGAIASISSTNLATIVPETPLASYAIVSIVSGPGRSRVYALAWDRVHSLDPTTLTEIDYVDGSAPESRQDADDRMRVKFA